MSLKKKAAQIDLGKLVAGVTAHSSPTANPMNPGVTGAGMTAIGMHAESVYRDRKIAEENTILKDENAGLSEKLAEFKGSEVTKKLDPKFVHASHWANRSEDSFKSKDFEALKSEMESAGGNVQPIKVRPMAGRAGEYEIVFGHRRHRVCLELGLHVLALIEPVSDVELFAQMDRENRQRADLRPYEQGVMYARALDEGLFSSMRKMAETLGVDQSNASKAVALARLPSAVLSAFDSPLVVQFNWSAKLTQALRKDPDLVLSRAGEISKQIPKPSASAVFSRLVETATGNQAKKKSVELVSKSGGKAKITFDHNKKTYTVDIRGLDLSRLPALEKMLKEL